MRSRRGSNTDMGEAISMEDAISMLTIVFVLFVIFLVPLVSIDRARLEEKLEDRLWGDVVSYLSEQGNRNLGPNEEKYQEVFEIYDPEFVKFTRLTHDGVTYNYIEFVTQDSALVIARHNLLDNTFNRMQMSKQGETTFYQHGDLTRLPSNDWFSPEQNALDYGDLDESKELNEEYRLWRMGEIEGNDN